MGHLNQVVQLDAFVNNGLPHCRTVYAGVGPNLHIVLDDDDAQLGNLLVTLSVRCKSETIGTNHAAGMDGDVATNLASVIDGDVRMDATSVANLHPFADVGKRSNVDVLADDCRLCNKGQRVYAGLLRQCGSIHLHQLGYTFVGIFHANERRFNGMFQLNVLIDEDDAGLGLVNILGVFRIREKRDGSLFSFFYLRESVYGGLLVSFHTTSDKIGNLLGCKFHEIDLSFV